MLAESNSRQVVFRLALPSDCEEMLTLASEEGYFKVPKNKYNSDSKISTNS